MAHYTPIVTGAAATADNVNDPLEQLSDAIDSVVGAEQTARLAGDNLLDDRIDNLIAVSETSSSETVDARAAGNVGGAATTLAERLEWIEGAVTVYAASYGFDDANTGTDNTTAINAAIAAAVALGEPSVVMLPAGRFTVSPFNLSSEVLLCGAGMPYHDRGGSGDLERGTILYNSGGAGAGVVAMSHGAGLMNLGIQTTADRNAITGAAANDCLIANVAVLGIDEAHGCVFTSGQRNKILNYYAADFEHGLVLKGMYNYAEGVEVWNGQISALTLASDNAADEDCAYNVIKGIRADGDVYCGGIKIYTGGGAGSGDCHSNTIMGLNLRNPAWGVYMFATVAGGNLTQYNRIIGGVIYNAQYAGVQLGTSGDTAVDGADYNDFSDLTVIDSGSESFVNGYGGIHNRLHNCSSFRSGNDVSGTWLKDDVNWAISKFNNTITIDDDVDGGDVGLVIVNGFSDTGSVDETASLRFRFKNFTGDAITAAAVRAGKEEAFGSAAAQSAFLAFLTVADGTYAERVRLTAAGALGVGVTVPETKLHVGGALTLDEVSANPANPTAGAAARMYVKGDLLVIQFMDGATAKYRTLNLAGTDATWAYTTTPP